MYQAKRKGGARHQIIDLREQNKASQRATLERDLRGAPARGELRIEYQPIVDASDGRITGVEALLRWAHPSRGLVPPAVLIPLAEQSGVITEIGLWVLEHACPDRHRWHNRLHTDELTLSVNVSADQLMAPDYVDIVAAVLDQTNTEPGLLTLEMTESVFVQDGERALVVLSELKHLGVALALDDFGTGYSSLNYLKRFPMDIVKIDQSFVADMQHDPASHHIISKVIELAHLLDMTVVAEGVETAEQHHLLATLGCDSCQGYYFGYPMPADNLDDMMRQNVDSGTVHLPALPPAAKAS
jgi:EAL domain-containing protein (putative c-di-GMP-specific phosphodiesterase class I)